MGSHSLPHPPRTASSKSAVTKPLPRFQTQNEHLRVHAKQTSLPQAWASGRREEPSGEDSGGRSRLTRLSLCAFICPSPLRCSLRTDSLCRGEETALRKTASSPATAGRGCRGGHRADRQLHTPCARVLWREAWAVADGRADAVRETLLSGTGGNRRQGVHGKAGDRERSPRAGRGRGAGRARRRPRV